MHGTNNLGINENTSRRHTALPRVATTSISSCKPSPSLTVLLQCPSQPSVGHFLLRLRTTATLGQRSVRKRILEPRLELKRLFDGYSDEPEALPAVPFLRHRGSGPGVGVREVTVREDIFMVRRRAGRGLCARSVGGGVVVVPRRGRPGRDLSQVDGRHRRGRGGDRRRDRAARERWGVERR